MNGLWEEVRVGLHGVWQRRWFALAVAWGICLLGWLVLAMIPNAYESKARVYVRTQSTVADRLSSGGNDAQRDVERVRQTLTSALNLERVVRSTALADTVANDRDVADRVASLQKQIKIVAQQENLFEVTATVASGGMSDAAAAKLSQQIVQKLIDIFVDENLSDDRTDNQQSLRFLDQQLAERQRQLAEAEAKRAEFEAKYMGMMPGTGSVAERVTQARRELGEVESNLVAAQSSLAAIGGQLAGTPQTIADSSGMGAGVGPARARLSAIEGQLSDARSKGWTDSHPDVIALSSQLGAARAAAAGERAGGGGSYGAPNPLYLSLRSMQADRQATVAALTARKQSLANDVETMLAKQTSEPEVVAEAARVNRDYQVLKDQYDRLLASREEISIQGRARTQTDAVRFRVIDPPVAPRAPAKPNRPLLLTAVLILGLIGGAAAAFGMNQLRVTYASAPRLAKATGMTVLGGVSEVVNQAGKALRRRRLKTFGGAAAALAGMWVVLLAVEFVQLGLVA